MDLALYHGCEALHRQCRLHCEYGFVLCAHCFMVAMQGALLLLGGAVTALDLSGNALQGAALPDDFFTCLAPQLRAATCSPSLASMTTRLASNGALRRLYTCDQCGRLAVLAGFEQGPCRAAPVDARLAGDVGRMLRTNCERRHAWSALILSAQRRQGRTFSAKTAHF